MKLRRRGRFQRPRAVAVERAALFLDLDGVLASHQSEPRAVLPSPQRTELLRQLRQSLSGRVAILSGRTLDDVDRITDGVVEAVAALNGLQRRAPERTIHDPPAHASLAEVTDILKGLARTWRGVSAEDKGLSVALHYRRAREAEAELLEVVGSLGRATGLAVQQGSMVVELATPGWDKGRAIADLMSAPPFREAVPIFIGDDAADEPGFATVRAAGGLGILVGEPRPSCAHGRLASPAELQDWLQRALCRGAFELPTERDHDPGRS